MKDLTHYFGHSPRSDESSSSLKENEASSTSSQGKSLGKKSVSSNVLDCKIPDNNLNVEVETPKAISADLVNKTQQQNSSTKRKPAVKKKKASVDDDEEFNVKSVKKPVKKRGKPQKEKSLEAVVPDIKPNGAAPENENHGTNAVVGSSCNPNLNSESGREIKDLTHYFEHSFRSDESTSSLQENQASSTSSQEKSLEKTAASSDVLKCKTPSDNLNIEADTPKPISTDMVNKTQQQNSSAKRKSSRKSSVKKLNISDDEEFEVKSVKKTVKKRGKPRKEKNSEAAKPDINLDLVAPENENHKTNAIIGSPPANRSLPQYFGSKKEATIRSPTPDDCTPLTGTKPNSAKHITHFFSPTKSSKAQPELNGIKDDQTKLHDRCSIIDDKKASQQQSEQKEKASKRESVKKSGKKVEKGAKSNDSSCGLKVTKNDSTKTRKGSSSLNDKGNAKGKEVCAQLKSKEPNKSDVKSSVCNAFQMLMSKKLNSQASTDLNGDFKSDESQCSNVLPDNEDKDDEECSPKEFVKRRKRNRVESETDVDSQSEVGNQQKKIATDMDTISNQDEPKRKSLMNYFQKISKEEAEIQSQKVQFKVEAIVHHSEGSPYKSNSKKEARPQPKIAKKKKVKKGCENEIEWLGSEEITVEGDASAQKSHSVPVSSTNLDQPAEEKCQEEKTNASEDVNSVLPIKRSLHINSSTSSSPRSKRLKQEATQVCGNTDTTVSDNPHTQDTVKKISPDLDDKPAEPSLPSTSKTSVKKLKQVSLMESPFLKKLGCDDSSSAEVVENSKDHELLTTRSVPTVSLSRMSPRNLKKAARGAKTVGKSPLKSVEKEPIMKHRESSSNIEVSVSCEGRSPPQESRGEESPRSPKRLSTEVTTPQARSWKMRVCLTPKPDMSKANSTVVSPIIVDTGSEDDFDVQEIAVVKKKKQRAKRESETKGPQPPEKDVEIIRVEKETSGNSIGAIKIAPLFMRSKKPDRISQQAKQEFLQSGVPEQVKKMIEVQRSFECTALEAFPQISHITQLDSVLPWTPSEGSLPLKAESCESDPIPSEFLQRGYITSCDPVGCKMTEVMSDCITSLHHQKRRIAKEHTPTVLSIVRAEHPNFEVIRYFKRLQEKYCNVSNPKVSATESSRKKRSRSTRRSRSSNQGTSSPERVPKISNLMWTDKYRPTSSDDIVGNKESVVSLKRWLEGLRGISQAAQAPFPKSKRSKKSDYEVDFVISDDNGDSNSSSNAGLSNSALLIGPHGSGKTNCVYALAADLGYKVFEINASERRSGKVILAKLSEATQSHQVGNRAQDQSSAKSNLFSPKTNSKLKASKRKIEKKNESEEGSNKCKLSLILVKDIDIVFDEDDDGFISAVASLISTSKRPVIFTTTEASCSSVKRLVNSSTLLLEFAPDTEALCSWLQIVSLLEGIYVARKALTDLLSSCNGDVRRCLLQLQVWMSTGGNHLLESSPSKVLGSTKKQENAQLDELFEWDINEKDLIADVNKSSLKVFEHYDCIGALQGRNDIELKEKSNRVNIPQPMSFGRVWWNVPRLLDLPEVQVSRLVLPDIPDEPRRFRGIFDDSLFDMASDDEDSQDLQNAGTKPTEETNPITESGEKTAENESETRAFDVERSSQEEVDAMLSHLQAMSTCDLLATASQLPELAADFEPTPRSWQKPLRASLSQTFPTTDGPNLLMEEISRSLCHWLTENSIEHTRSIVVENPGAGRYDALLPDQQIQRRRLDVEESEENALGAVASCVRLERSAIAVDYLPTVRRIFASEQKRLERNSSRRNRFYHYSRNLGLSLSSDQAIVLSSS